MQSNNKRNFKILISLLLTSVVIFFSFIQYYYTVSDKKLEETKDELFKKNALSYDIFKNYALETINKLHVVSNVYFEDNSIAKSIKDDLRKIFFNEFDSMANRIKLYSRGEFFDIVNEKEDVIKNLFENNEAFFYAIDENKMILDKLLLFVTVRDNNRITGVLSTYFTLEEIRNFFTVNRDAGEHIAHIMDSNGNIVFGEEKYIGKTLYEILDKGQILSGEGIERIKDLVDIKKDFTIKFRSKGNDYFLFFKSGINNYTAIEIVDASFINKSIFDSYKLGLSIIIQIVIIQLVYFLVLIIFQNKKLSKIESNRNKEIETIINNVNGGVLKVIFTDNIFKIIFANDKFYSLCGYNRGEYLGNFDNNYISLINDTNKDDIIKCIKDKVKNKEDIAIEHKLKTKDNKVCYISFTGKYFGMENNAPVYQCILIDYTSYKHLYDELQVEKERYNIIAKISDEIMFEYNIEDNTMDITGNFEEKFNISINIDNKNFVKSLLQSGIVHKDDIKNIINLVRSIRRGEYIFNDDIRLKTRNGQYKWIKYQGSTIKNFENTVYKVVGRISDITKLREEIEELKEKSSKDPLTKVYNKLAIESIANNAISEKSNKKYALFVIDVDNFKMVNDTFGHIFGDEVLKKVATNILSVFSENEIIARIGGDEFVVFIKDVESMDYVIKQATIVCDLFRKTYNIEGKDHKISASVGIALYPKHATTYKELLRIADIAVYNAKKGGKDRYEIYDTDMSHISLSDIQNMYNDEEEHMSTKQSISFNNILVDIAEMFLHVKDISATIDLVFDIMSKKYNIDRAYILYRDDKTQNIYTIYDWKKYEERSYTHIKYNIDFDDEEYLSLYGGNTFIHYEDFKNEYDEDILPYIYENDNIKSFFTSYFMDSDSVRGYLVIESYEKPIVHSDIENIFIISRFITTQIIKNEDTRKIVCAKKMTEAVVRSQSLYAYVIDSKFKMLYFDDKIKEIIPDAKIGNAYKLGDCEPSVDIEYIQSNNIELNETFKRDYFCKIQNKPFEISITKIRWINTEYAYLICLRDIS